jgi:hypothetical protein
MKVVGAHPHAMQNKPGVASNAAKMQFAGAPAAKAQAPAAKAAASKPHGVGARMDHKA